MIYKFECNACRNRSEFDVRMLEYDDWKKSEHQCPKCGKISHFSRVFEPFEGNIQVGGFGVSSPNNWKA